MVLPYIFFQSNKMYCFVFLLKIVDFLVKMVNFGWLQTYSRITCPRTLHFTLFSSEEIYNDCFIEILKYKWVLQTAFTNWRKEFNKWNELHFHNTNLQLPNEKLKVNFKNILNDCDSVVLEVYLDHKFQWPQVGLNCESLKYDVVTKPTRP